MYPFYLNRNPLGKINKEQRKETAACQKEIT
jgi:hypothetical protein